MTTTTLRQWKINSRLDVSYTVQECENLLDPANTTLLETPDGHVSDLPRLIVADTGVMAHHGERIRAYLAANRVHGRIHQVDGGEANKDIRHVLDIARELNDLGTHRSNNPLIAIGGGVSLDIAGLAAGLYRRGIPYVRIPTTLLSQVDVAVAAKTGVNFDGYRNRLGSYTPAARTLIDRSFLTTLKAGDFRSGLGEIFKLAVIKDAHLFALLERHGAELLAERFQTPDSGEVIARAIGGMAVELEPNLWEKDLRRAVDFGHSFSPLIEMRSRLAHGEAVALDCLFSCFLAQQRGLLAAGDIDRVLTVMQSIGLPLWHPLFCDPGALAEALDDTMRHRDGNQHLPVPAPLGRHRFLEDLTPAEIRAAAERMAALQSRPR